MKSPLAAVKRQRFPARASHQLRGLFILCLGSIHSNSKKSQPWVVTVMLPLKK